MCFSFGDLSESVDIHKFRLAQPQYRANFGNSVKILMLYKEEMKQCGDMCFTHSQGGGGAGGVHVDRGSELFLSTTASLELPASPTLDQDKAKVGTWARTREVNLIYKTKHIPLCDMVMVVHARVSIEERAR